MSWKRFKRSELGKSREKFCYVIRAVDHPWIKVGSSFDLEQRLNDMKTAQPFETVVMCLFRDGTPAEADLKHYLSRFRVAREWFSWGGDCRDAIIKWESSGWKREWSHGPEHSSVEAANDEAIRASWEITGEMKLYELWCKQDAEQSAERIAAFCDGVTSE